MSGGIRRTAAIMPASPRLGVAHGWSSLLRSRGWCYRSCCCCSAVAAAAHPPLPSPQAPAIGAGTCRHACANVKRCAALWPGPRGADNSWLDPASLRAPPLLCQRLSP